MADKNENVFKKSLAYIGKLLSITLMVLLLLIFVFLIYYIISFRISERNGTTPRFTLYTIISESMEPYIKVNDVIVNIRVDDPSRIQVRDVITFRSTSLIHQDSSTPITHRVIEIRNVDGRYYFITKGDNNSVPDTEPVSEENVIGRMVFSIPQLGRLQFFFRTTFGLIAIILAAVTIIIYDVWKLSKIYKAQKKSDSLEQSEITIEELNKQAEDKKIDEVIQNIKRKTPLFIESEKPNDEKIYHTQVMMNVAFPEKSNLTSKHELDKEKLKQAIEKMNIVYLMPEKKLEIEEDENLAKTTSYEIFGDDDAYFEAPVNNDKPQVKEQNSLDKTNEE